MNIAAAEDDEVGCEARARPVAVPAKPRKPCRPPAAPLQDEFVSDEDEDAALKGGGSRGHDSGRADPALASLPHETLPQRAARHLGEGRWEAAVNDFSAAIKARPGAAHEGELLLGRAAAYCGLSRHLRAIPAAESECRALYAPDPEHLAASALRDADAAVRLQAGHIADLHAARGAALFLLERYGEAAEAYSVARLHAPGSLLLAQRAEECAQANAPTAAAAAAAGPAEPARSCNFAALRAQALQDAECILCLKLLYEPVTTPCGHTFCRPCFARASDHANKCPMCRTVLHAGRALPVSIVLKNLLERSFPEDYAARREEEAAAAAVAATAAEHAPLPLFVMNVLLPGERMALNIFEPRYRLMVRRVMEGSRRFGMAAVDRDHELCDVSPFLPGGCGLSTARRACRPAGHDCWPPVCASL